MELEIVLKYDFDPEQGYTTKSIILDTNEVALYEDILYNKRKLIINLYKEDIEELLKDTGVELYE